MSRCRNSAVLCRHPSMLARVWFLCAVGSAAALPSLGTGNMELHSHTHVSAGKQTEEAHPQEIVIGHCTVRLWPKSNVWKLQDGDIMKMVAVGTEKCNDAVTITVEELDGGRIRSKEVLKSGLSRVDWSLGRAHPSLHGLMLQVRLSYKEHATFTDKLLDVEFEPRVKMLTQLPYQGQNLFVYFLYLLFQRQKELVTGVSMDKMLGWDMDESTSLKVKVAGNPKPNVVWRVSKQDITPGSSLGLHYVAMNETVITSTESVYEIELWYVTLKMAQKGVKLIARNKLNQKILRINLPVNMFPIAEQRSLADAITRSIGLVALIFAGMVLIHVVNGIYTYVARIAKKQWDGVTFHILFLLVPVRILRKVFNLVVGMCISLGLLRFFGMGGKYVVMPRVLFYSLFVMLVTYLYGRHTRVRAAFCLVVIGMLSHTGIFLLIVSTAEMVLYACHAITKNLVESSLQVHCISQIHVELFRESMLAYLAPVKRKKSEYAEVQLVKERDMSLAQESMKLGADIALNDVQGEKFGEQKVSQTKNTIVDRNYQVRRFADVQEKAKGGRADRTKIRKKFVFKSMNVCQDIGSNVLIQCILKTQKVYHKCLGNFPGILKPMGRGICGLLTKHVNCKTMYKNTIKNFKCDTPVDSKEIAEGLLLLRDGPEMFYGDSSPHDLQQMYSKPVNIQFAQDKPRESKEEVLQKLQDAKSLMSTFYIVAIIGLVMGSANKVLGEMTKYDMNINWENIYIGNYFRKIDRKRGKLGFPRLLPLKGIEKQIYIESIFSTKAKEEERNQVKLKSSLCFGIQLLTAIIFMVDYLVFTVTIYEVVNENTTYSLTIDDYLRVSSRGDSFFALLINLVFEKINVENRVIKTYRVDQCNPKVVFPNLELYARQEALILFLFLFTFVLQCPDRLKHVVFRYYYPRREKKRQIKLYTNILLTREKFVQLALKQMLWTRAHGKLTAMNDPQWQDLLLRQFRGFSFILSYFFKSTCSICKTTGGKKYVMCQGPGCTMVYCRQCWRILGSKCLSCNLVISIELMERFGTAEKGLFDN